MWQILLKKTEKKDIVRFASLTQVQFVTFGLTHFISWLLTSASLQFDPISAR